MTEDPGTEKNKQDTQFRPGSIGQPSIKPNTIPKQTDPKPYEQHTQEGTNPAKPIFVQVIGGDDLEPFEKETLAISKKTLWVAVSAFGAALIAAVFVGSQVTIMSYQTQIMASQSEGANAGALMDEMNTRKQLGIVQEQADAAQKQAKAAQESAKAIQRQMRVDQRPWLFFNTDNADAFGLQDGLPIVVPIEVQNLGKTPARRVVGHLVITTLKAGEDDPWVGRGKFGEGDPARSLSMQTLYNTIPMTRPITVKVWDQQGNPADLILKPELHKALDNGEYTIIIYGRFDYWDGFGVPHWMTFCHQRAVLVERRSRTCVEYNNADSN